MSSEQALWTATGLAAAIRSRELSSRELLDAYVARIERHNPELNAVVTLDLERARDEAARADSEAARDEWRGPLHGLPITVKDAIATAGLRSTGGAVELRDHIPSEDAPAVARLRAAGAVIFGKTNLPRWSGDMQTYNELFGTTNNPWDVTRTPGGSSGGAGAAVAAGLTSFELGTDLGGSVRIPSSFCGVCGHKPSFGVVPQRGYVDHVGAHITDCDMNTFGPLARSVDDLELLLGVLAGPPDDLAPAWRLELPPPRRGRLGDYRIGVWLDDPACPVEPDVAGVLSAAVDALDRAGAPVDEARPDVDLAETIGLFGPLIGAAVAPGLGPEAGEALAGSHYAWLVNDERRAALRARWAEWFESYDVLLCPVAPVAPFAHNHHEPLFERRIDVGGRSRPYLDAVAWTGGFNVTYLPSTVVPAGRTSEGLPVGMQVVAPFLEDRTGLAVARALEAATGGYTPPPAFVD